MIDKDTNPELYGLYFTLSEAFNAHASAEKPDPQILSILTERLKSLEDALTPVFLEIDGINGPKWR